MTNFELRKFEFGQDIETVCEFHKDHVKINFPDSLYKEDLFKKGIREGLEKKKDDLFMVLDPETKKAIGFLWLRIEQDVYKEISYGDLHYIHLTPETRGKGIGTQLMEFTEEHFKKKGAKEIRLGTDANNVASRRLYEKKGFVLKRVVYEKKI